MARRKLTIDLAPIVAAVAGEPIDDLEEALLDATESLMRDFGLARWSVEDVAERAGVGRTSVYRRFPSRDDLVHGVLARELRTTLLAVASATAGMASFEDRAVEAAAVCFDALAGSVVDHLLRIDPAAVLPLLTTDAEPLLHLARGTLTSALLAAGFEGEPEHASIVAESLARLGLSFVLTPATVLPVDHPAKLRSAVRALVRPILTARPSGSHPR